MEEDLEDWDEIGESSPLLTKAGSNYYQSLFNSCNILLGIGLLSLPFAFQITGWLIGMGLLILFSLMTWHTGTLLQKCLDYDQDNTHSSNFGDLGQVAFGDAGRRFISLIFFLELIAVVVALIILSADSIVSLLPSLDLNLVKLFLMTIIFPTTLPKSLSIASFGSLMGLLALLNLTTILLYDGLSTPSGPGSLWTPADTFLLPQELYLVPFSFGLIMSGFAGHGVFPNIYRDMKTPKLYGRMLATSYIIVFTIYALVATVAYLMFGSDIKEEVLLVSNFL
jgi:amino acid permease